MEECLYFSIQIRFIKKKKKSENKFTGSFEASEPHIWSSGVPSPYFRVPGIFRVMQIVMEEIFLFP